uniref:Zinc/iron permease n=1 Tax=Parastrongyloides trichosuri TaxID=131310 RepID=A0A0N4ZS42_PARTI
MSDIILQIVLAIVMLIVTIVAGLIPLKICKKLLSKDGTFSKSATKIMTLLTCFGGGVFMATCFLDIFPHMLEEYEEVQKLFNKKFSYPFPQFFACIGFFLVYGIEEFSIKFFGMSHSHDHGSSSSLAKKDFSNENEETFPEENISTENYYTVGSHHNAIDESVAYMSNSETKEASILKTLTFTFVMSFHSLLEGFALGIQDKKASIIALFVSLILHKAIEAFTVGLQITKSNTGRIKLVLITIALYAVMTPIGSLIGVGFKNASIDNVSKAVICNLLESIACGTFIYVTFLEVLATEKNKEKYPIWKLSFIFLGFSVIAAFQVLDYFFEEDEVTAEY